jgi:hypothetical protein
MAQVRSAAIQLINSGGSRDVDLEQKELAIRIAFALLGFIGLWFLAKRKNHNPWLWGGIGGAAAIVMPILILVPLLVVGFLKYRCPKCGTSISNAEAKEGRCPKCGPAAAAA